MRTLFSLIIVALLLVMPVVVSAHTEGDPFKTDLIAGQTEDIGEVLVWNDGSNLYVRYVVDVPYWHLADTHLAVATSLDDIPQTKKQNPKPGNFPYDEASSAYKENGLYEIPLGDWGPDTELYIAAHGVACLDLVSSLLLPDQATEMVYNPGAYGYFQKIISGGSILDGTYENGFCIDTDDFGYLYEGVEYTADVYSSYDPNFPGGIVENPENLDLVNYVLNHYSVGQIAEDGDPFTYGDIQKAIWLLVEGDLQSVPEPPGAGPWTWDHVNEILAAAEDNGEGFIPGCDDLVVIVFVPYDEAGDIVQPDIIPYPVKCDCDTAWGYGPGFPGNSWAMYFTYEVQEDGNGDGAPPRMSLDSSVTTTWGSIKNR